MWLLSWLFIPTPLTISNTETERDKHQHVIQVNTPPPPLSPSPPLSSSPICLSLQHHYIPEKRSFRGYYVFDSNAAAPPPSAAAAAAASSHHFVVSAITFEGFKLRSSNLTHTLFIQISRTSSITDIVVQSKMAAGGHFVKKLKKKKSCVSI